MRCRTTGKVQARVSGSFRYNRRKNPRIDYLHFDSVPGASTSSFTIERSSALGIEALKTSIDIRFPDEIFTKEKHSHFHIALHRDKQLNSSIRRFNSRFLVKGSATYVQYNLRKNPLHYTCSHPSFLRIELQSKEGINHSWQLQISHFPDCSLG